MKIGLTGATGQLGRVIFDSLLREGFQVRTLGRTPVGDDFLSVDITDVLGLSRALADCDLIVHAAGKETENAETQLIWAMAEAVGLASVKCCNGIINLSSLAVYGKVQAKQVDETAPCNPITEYGKSRLEAEKALARTGTFVTHLRIGNVYSPDTFALVSESRIRRFLKGSEVTNLVFAEDVADVVVSLVKTSPAERPRILNVVRPGIGQQTYKQVLTPHPRRRSWVPTPPVLVPHLVRKLNGTASLPENTRYVSAGLVKMGFRFRPMSATANGGRFPASISKNIETLSDLRILHATDSISRRTGGGVASRTLDVAEQLAKRGAHTSVVSMEKGLKAVSRSTMNSVRHLVVPGFLSRFMVPTWHIRDALSLVQQHDVLHLMGHWSLLNIALARRAESIGVPYVICPAGSLKIWGRSKHLKRVFNVAVGHRYVSAASGWIAVVEDELDDFREHGVQPHQVAVIPNGAELDQPKPTLAQVSKTRTELGLPENYVLFLGRLNAIKGPDLLLQAYVAIARDVGFDLVFAGPDVGMQNELEKAAEDSEVPNRIHFVGYVHGNTKQNLISGCTALIIPSRKEAMSVVVMEAASHCKPVLATTECGLTELLTGGGGWVVPPDAAGLQDGLLALTSEELSVIGNELSDRVRARYNWDRLSKMYLELYQQVCRASLARLKA